MIKRLRKIGNSTGVIIDKSVLKLLDLRTGDDVRLEVDRGVLTVRPAPRLGQRPARTRWI